MRFDKQPINHERLWSTANHHEGLGSCDTTTTATTDLYGLDAELQHLVAGGAGEVNMDASQRGEHQFLRQLVDQRHTQALLQVHQHLVTGDT